MKRMIALALVCVLLLAGCAGGKSKTMTHEQYTAAEMQSEVVVETYVQAHQSWWDNKVTVYCQSPDGAYFLYELACSEADAEKLVPGTKIRVTGSKGEWAGEVEIMDGTFEFVKGDSFIAQPLDVTDLLGTDALIEHQNELVSFTGMTVENIEYKNGEPGDDIYVTLGHNGGSYSFCVEVYLTGTDSDVYTTVGSLNVGDTVAIDTSAGSVTLSCANLAQVPASVSVTGGGTVTFTAVPAGRFADALTVAAGAQVAVRGETPLYVGAANVAGSAVASVVAAADGSAVAG